MHTGESKTCGGRAGDASAEEMSLSLRDCGFELARFKTGTPCRLNGRTIHFDRLEVQPGDFDPQPFSFATDRITQDQLDCHITYTNPAVHELIRANLHRAPMYSGQIQSRGPRYCPSIEDKVVRFADKTSHQIFLEPEGLNTREYYCNGISTSLPKDVQQAMLKLIPGLENAEVMRSVAKLNGRGSASPGCGSHLVKSMVRPLRRQGVPVLKRASWKPQAARLSLSASADWSPARPPRVLASPMCMRALRNVPVVRMTALAL